MPLYRVQVFKRIGVNGKEWSNSYHVRGTDLQTAVNYANTIASAEISVHKNNVEFVRARVSSATPGDTNFSTVPINIFGAIPVTSGQLPLFNTARVDFEVFGGRPSYKYLRVPLDENETQNGEITSTLAGLLQTSYIAPLLALSPETVGGDGLVDESGNDFTSATVQRPIQERQLRRRRRSTGSGGISGS